MALGDFFRLLFEGVPWEIVITVLLTLIGSASPFAVYQYYRRPKPVTGVLPLDEISQEELDLAELGDRSPGDEILFVKEEFAHEVTSLETVGTADRLMGNTRQFTPLDREVTVPILFQNRGERDMREYKATITFHVEQQPETASDQVEIRDVHTETLEIDGLFCEPERFRGNHTDKIPNQKIIDMYQNLGLPGHFVSLHGSLGSGTMEVIIMELYCPPAIDDFYILIGIDSPDWFVGEKMFCQRITVGPEAEN